MTIASDFDYRRPATLEEAVALLAGCDRPLLLAGGTDVIPWLRNGLASPGMVVDIKAVPGLDRIEWRDGAVHIGSLVTFSDLIASEEVAATIPVLAEASHTVASVGVRNRATLVGNLCSAVPSCDAGPALLVLDAAVEVVGPDGQRGIPITEWFRGVRRTSLGPGEIVTGIAIPDPGRHGACYVKLSRYRGEDLAQVGVAVLVRPGGESRVAFGAVAPVPFRAPAIEEYLAGRALDDDTRAGLAPLVDAAISPIDDMRASKEYRYHMSRVMLLRGLAAAAARLEGGGPPYGEQVI